MFAPWLAHHYPGLTPDRLIELRWSTYVALYDAVRKNPLG